MTSFLLAWIVAGAWLLVAALGVHLARQLLVDEAPD